MLAAAKTSLATSFRPLGFKPSRRSLVIVRAEKKRDCDKCSATDEVVKELDALHSRVVGVVRSLGTRRKEIEKIRYDTLMTLRSSMLELVAQELDSIKSLAKEVVAEDAKQSAASSATDDIDSAFAESDSDSTTTSAVPANAIDAVFVDKIN